MGPHGLANSLLWLLASVPAASCARDGGGQGQAFMAAYPAAAKSAFGALGEKMCGLYADTFAAKGAKRSACKDTPVRDLCSDFAGFCAGSLNLTRCQMPQIPSAFGEHKKDFRTWKAAAASDGVAISQVSITAKELATHVPSQKFLDRCEVCHMAWEGKQCFADGVPSAETCKSEEGGCYCLWATGVSVTEDRHILDGHHRWAATKILLADKILPPKTKAVVEHYHHEG